MKKLLSILVASSITLSLTGCGEKKKEAPKSDEKITITWLAPFNESAEEGTAAEKLLEERFNVEIKPTFVAQSGYADKKNMLLASGDIPDIIYELDPSHVATDASQGLLAKVDYKTIEEYAPSLYKIIKEEAPKAWLYSRVEGDNYGIPNLNYPNQKGRLGAWRMDWLKNVGIDKVPETIDEMHDALVKITNEDPDGNGQKDTYGMTSDITNWHTMFTEIFGAYGVLPFNWMEQDGKVVYGGFADGTTEALDLIASWYKEGLIHPDFITDNIFQTGKEKFTSGQIGYMNQNGGYINYADVNSLDGITKQLNPGAEVVSSKFVKGPNGDSGTQAWGVPCHIVSFGVQVEEDEAKLAKILEIFDALSSDEELINELKLGEEGVVWKYRDESAGYGGGIDWVTPYDDGAQRTMNCIDNSFGSPTFFCPVALDRTIYDNHTETALKEFDEEYKTLENGHTDLFLKPDTLPSAADYFADLRTQQINLMVKVIKGEMTSADYVSQFKAIWENAGGTQLEQEAKEMQDEINTMLDEI